jgi:hypothetical protein
MMQICGGVRMNRNLELAAENIMAYAKNSNVVFSGGGVPILGRNRHGSTHTIEISLWGKPKKEWPDHGVSDFGFWLAKQWIERIPHWKNSSSSIELVWLGRHEQKDCLGNPFSHYFLFRPAVFMVKK